MVSFPCLKPNLIIPPFAGSRLVHCFVNLSNLCLPFSCPHTVSQCFLNTPKSITTQLLSLLCFFQNHRPGSLTSVLVTYFINTSLWVCICVYVCTYAHMLRAEVDSRCLLQMLSTLLFEIRSLTKPSVHLLISLAGQCALGIHLSSFSKS